MELSSLDYRDAGHGYDVFGMHPRAVETAVRLCRFVHDKYFRVESHGSSNLPRHGAAILAANHSGMLPIDAAMIVTDVVLGTDPARVPRSVGDRFIPRLPVLGTLFSRIGMVAGNRENFRYLLDSGELVLVFPEGAPGIGKGYSRRYELQRWRVGHAELGLRHRVPIVPVAVIGAEESWPQLARIDRFHAFGVPFLPIPMTPLPLPTHFQIHYGEPIALHERWNARDADDPDIVERAADLVRNAVADLIRHGLSNRNGVFR